MWGRHSPSLPNGGKESDQMAANKNDASTIGFQIGRLIQQYNLRITRANYRAKLMDEERLKASSVGQTKRALEATISRDAWVIYAKNLTNKRTELAEEVKTSLIGYNANEKSVWWSYFVERKSAEKVAQETGFSLRSVQRFIASMKAEMECRFNQIPPRMEEIESPRWSHIELAHFLEEKPNDDYIKAVKDLIDYGVISVDLLEFDPDFQAYLRGERR